MNASEREYKYMLEGCRTVMERSNPQGKRAGDLGFLRQSLKSMLEKGPVRPRRQGMKPKFEE